MCCQSILMSLDVYGTQQSLIWVSITEMRGSCTPCGKRKINQKPTISDKNLRIMHTNRKLMRAIQWLIITSISTHVLLSTLLIQIGHGKWNHCEECVRRKKRVGGRNWLEEIELDTELTLKLPWKLNNSSPHLEEL